MMLRYHHAKAAVPEAKAKAGPAKKAPAKKAPPKKAEAPKKAEGEAEA